MLIEILDKLLYRSAMLRYSMITISFIFLGLITYYLWVIPFQEQYQSEKREGKHLQDEALILNNKLDSYPKYQQLITDIEMLEVQRQNYSNYSINKVIQIISQQLLNNQLTLIDLDRQDDNNNCNVNFTLQGNYHALIQFIYQLSKLNLNISINRISVIRKADSLVFLLSIFYQGKQAKAP